MTKACTIPPNGLVRRGRKSSSSVSAPGQLLGVTHRGGRISADVIGGTHFWGTFVLKVTRADAAPRPTFSTVVISTRGSRPTDAR